jgi:hypothetical protein
MSHPSFTFTTLSVLWLGLIAYAWRVFFIANKERVDAMEAFKKSTCEHCPCHAKGLYCCYCLDRRARV